MKFTTCTTIFFLGASSHNWMSDHSVSAWTTVSNPWTVQKGWTLKFSRPHHEAAEEAGDYTEGAVDRILNVRDNIAEGAANITNEALKGQAEMERNVVQTGDDISRYSSELKDDSLDAQAKMEQRVIDAGNEWNEAASDVTDDALAAQANTERRIVEAGDDLADSTREAKNEVTNKAQRGKENASKRFEDGKQRAKSIGDDEYYDPIQKSEEIFQDIEKDIRQYEEFGAKQSDSSLFDVDDEVSNEASDFMNFLDKRTREGTDIAMDTGVVDYSTDDKAERTKSKSSDMRNKDSDTVSSSGEEKGYYESSSGAKFTSSDELNLENEREKDRLERAENKVNEVGFSVGDKIKRGLDKVKNIGLEIIEDTKDGFVESDEFSNEDRE